MKKIKLLFERLTSRIKKPSPRKILIFTLCVICFLIPTFLALSIVFADDSDYVADSLSVELYDPAHVLIAEESGEPTLEKKNSLVDIIYHMITDSTEIEAPPVSPEESTPMYASVVFNGERAEYTCYFSFLNDSNFYVDGSGKFFLIDSTTSNNFLSSIYAESLYSKATPPKLLTNTGVEVIPSSGSWFYRLYDNTYREALNYKTTSRALLYEFSEIFGLRFEDEPDECTARVFENGTLIYEGSREALNDLKTSGDSTIRITVDAKWNQQSGALFHGNVSYNFDASVYDRADFSINSNTLTEGSFIILSCTNANDISKISFESEIPYSPIFCKDGKKVCALIPYPKSTAKSTLDFSVSYGASTKSFSVALKKQPVIKDVYTLSSSSQELFGSISSSDIAKKDDLIKELSTLSGNTVFYRGSFLSPLDSGFRSGYVFGAPLSTSDGISLFTAFGNEYLSANAGQSVRALCTGKVLSTGYCDALGNYAVVDHGLGLLSWYCHLSDFDTSVGKTLAAGESVGKSGSGGFADGDGVLILITLNGEILDTSLLIN